MPVMKGYGQFCPVAKASEILAERWTPLVLRELLAGSHRFNDLHRGVPLMSRSLLSKRLSELERAGVVEKRSPGSRRSHEYHLTPAGEELRPVIESLGTWGQRWAVAELSEDDLDPALLMWDVHRNMPGDEMPEHRAVVRFELVDVDGPQRRWWLMAQPEGGDVCMTDPGFEVDLHVRVSLRVLTRYWLGHSAWRDVLASDDCELTGPRWAQRALPRWMGRSPLSTLGEPVREVDDGADGR